MAAEFKDFSGLQIPQYERNEYLEREFFSGDVVENSLEIINECEANARAYFMVRDEYLKEMDDASHIGHSESRSAVEQGIRDKYLKKEDGTYYDSLEDAFHINDGIMISDYEKFEDVQAEFDEIKYNICKFGAEGHDPHDIPLSDYSVVMTMQDANKACEDMRNQTTNKDMVINAYNIAMVQTEAHDITDRENRPLPSPSSPDEAIARQLAEVSKRENHLIMYLEESKQVEKEVESISGELPDAIKDKHLKKVDGTYFSSLEEKYGLTGAENIKSIDDVKNDLGHARDMIKQGLDAGYEQAMSLNNNVEANLLMMADRTYHVQLGNDVVSALTTYAEEHGLISDFDAKVANVAVGIASTKIDIEKEATNLALGRGSTVAEPDIQHQTTLPDREGPSF